MTIYILGTSDPTVDVKITRADVAGKSTFLENEFDYIDKLVIQHKSRIRPRVPLSDFTPLTVSLVRDFIKDHHGAENYQRWTVCFMSLDMSTLLEMNSLAQLFDHKPLLILLNDVFSQKGQGRPCMCMSDEKKTCLLLLYYYNNGERRN